MPTILIYVYNSNLADNTVNQIRVSDELDQLCFYSCHTMTLPPTHYHLICVQSEIGNTNKDNT